MYTTLCNRSAEESHSGERVKSDRSAEESHSGKRASGSESDPVQFIREG